MIRNPISLILISTLASSLHAQDWSFTLDGQAVKPRIYSLNGTPDDPQVGDVVEIGGFKLVLDGDAPLDFVRGGEEGKGLYRVARSGKKSLVAVKVDWVTNGANRHLVDGSQGLSAQELAEIRGIQIGWDGKSRWFSDVLGKLDLSRTCVELSNSNCTKRGNSWTYYVNQTETPPFPVGLRYLLIREDFGSFASLADARDLRLLVLGGAPDVTWEQVMNKPELRYADFSYCDLRTVRQPDGEPSPSSCSNLRTLILRRAENRSDLDPGEMLSSVPRWIVEGLKELRVLDLSMSKGLQGLVSLEHPALVHLDLSGTVGYPLPKKPIHSLRILRALGADWPDADVATFKALHPRCKIVQDWNAVFRNAMSASTRIRIRDVMARSGLHKERKTLLDVRDPKEISGFLSLIDIDAARSGGYCMCGGSEVIEFYANKILLGSVSVHHASSLRWADGLWIGDARLTTRSRDLLAAWLDRRGMHGPREELEEQRRESEARRKAKEKWLAAMPPSLRAFWGRSKYGNKDINAMHAALAKEIPDLSRRIRALLNWYGSGTGSWSGYPAYESAAMELLYKYRTSKILAAIADVTFTTELKEGAARFFGSSSFRQQRRNHLEMLPKSLKQLLLEHCLATSDTESFKQDWAKSSFGGR